MSAGRYNFTLEAGATFTRTFTYTDPDDDGIDLTGSELRMQIRDTYQSTTSAISLESVAGGDGGITITDAAEGEFQITITDTQTESISFKQGVYDIEVEYSNGTVERLLEGRVKIKPQVTQ